MHYLKIKSDSIMSLREGKFEEVKTRIASQLVISDMVWIHPKVYWIPYYRTEDTSGIILPVIRKNHEPRVSIPTNYLRYHTPDCSHFTETVWKTTVLRELEIAYYKQMSCYGLAYKRYASSLESYYTEETIGDTKPIIGADSLLFGAVYNNKERIFSVARCLACGKPELSVFYVVDATEYVETHRCWERWEQDGCKELLLSKQTFTKYYISGIPQLYESLFPTELTKFLRLPETIPLLESVFACAYHAQLF